MTLRPSAAAAEVASDLVTALIDALNGTDAQRVAFVRERMTPGPAPEARAERMKGLVEQGAPFRLVRVLEARGPNEIRAIVADGHGMNLGFLLQIADGKLGGVRVGPPDDIDAPAPKDYSGWTDLAMLVHSIRVDTGVPALGVAYARGNVRERAADGIRTVGKPGAIATSDPWKTGSIGKPLCATAAACLIDAGKLRFASTIGDVLHDVPMQDGYRRVTLEQLLRHRGGVPEDSGMDRATAERIAGGATDRATLRRNYVADILGRAPAGPPDTRFRYSNAGYALAAAMVERAGGAPYEALLHRLIFAPLQMRASFTGADALPDARPSGHVKGPNGIEPADMRGLLDAYFAGAGGGIWMSLDDLVTFGLAHLAGLQGRPGLLRPATVARLHAGVLEEPGGDRRYACGWGIERRPGIAGEVHGHNGSDGTMRAELAIFPGAGVVAAAFVNVGGENSPGPPLQAVNAVGRRFAATPRRS